MSNPKIPTHMPISGMPIRTGPSTEDFQQAIRVINQALLRLHQLLYAGINSYAIWMAQICRPSGQIMISPLLEAIGPDEDGKEITISGRTPRRSLQVSL